VVDIANPLAAEGDGADRGAGFGRPARVAVQFRYAFVVDREGLKVLDVTALANPRVIPGAKPRSVMAQSYVARTYVYVAAGSEGLVIVDAEKPERPVIDQSSMRAGRFMTPTT